MKYWLVIPCYNVEKQILRVLEDFVRDANVLTLFEHIAIVDNRSTDQTIAVAKQYVIKNKLLKIGIYQNFENYGLGGTHKIGFQLAAQNKCDFLAVLHGDHQATTKQLIELVELSRRNGCTILGSRFMSGSKLQGYSPLRTLGNLSLNLVYSMFLKKKILDLGVGINIFQLRQFATEDFLSFDNGFTFNMDVLIYLASQGQKSIYAPIEWKVADEKSNAKIFQIGWVTFIKIIKHRFLKTKTKKPVILYQTTKIL